MTGRRAAVVALAAAVLAGGGILAAVSGGGEAAPATAERSQELVLTPDAVDREGAPTDVDRDPRSHPRVVELRGAGSKPKFDEKDARADGLSPGAPSDAAVKADLREARSELKKFKRYLGTTAFLQTGPRAKVLPDGTAVAPDHAPEPVKKIIQAGNASAKFPYKWGGGHGAWRDDGYDCSGSV
ncbi:MAG TPA: hypothetical protein VGV10_06470, partial [Thermoleophilaceae bacterium]|nr:hypothetical protein [Thermoleophilaceae bacterium]